MLALLLSTTFIHHSTLHAPNRACAESCGSQALAAHSPWCWPYAGVLMAVCLSVFIAHRPSHHLPFRLCMLPPWHASCFAMDTLRSWLAIVHLRGTPLALPWTPCVHGVRSCTCAVPGPVRIKGSHIWAWLCQSVVTCPCSYEHVQHVLCSSCTMAFRPLQHLVCLGPLHAKHMLRLPPCCVLCCFLCVTVAVMGQGFGGPVCVVRFPSRGLLEVSASELGWGETQTHTGPSRDILLCIRGGCVPELCCFIMRERVILSSF